MAIENDLVGLIDDANRAISGKAQQPTAKRRTTHSFSLLGKIIVLALIPVALFTAADRFTTDELTDIAVETQLINILHSAQNSVRTHVSNNGSLPPVLPSAALAAVVEYTIEGSRDSDRYTLSASSNGITVSMDSLGNLTTVFDRE